MPHGEVVRGRAPQLQCAPGGAGGAGDIGGIRRVAPHRQGLFQRLAAFVAEGERGAALGATDAETGVVAAEDAVFGAAIDEVCAVGGVNCQR